jgi:hypothetical protein
MDAIRLESFEENSDVALSPDLCTEDLEETVGNDMGSSPDLRSKASDELEVAVVDSTPGLVLILRSSWGFREPTD